MSAIDLTTIDQCTGGRIGQFDVPCPLCSPFRKPRNQRLKVLRVYRISEDFAGYSCIHCGEKGYARDRDATPPDPAKMLCMRAEAVERERASILEGRRKAHWFCKQSAAPKGTLVETYLREARGCRGLLPATLRFLPAQGEHDPAMLACYGFAAEPEPGRLAIALDDVVGVQLTALVPDGSGRAPGKSKKSIGRSLGVPITLAPANDLLALAIAEGIEDALSSHDANGWGVWAAGGAARMPALAAAIPSWIESVTILKDPDPDGERFALELAGLVASRSMEVRLTGGGGAA
jgi:hypothetical protein